ncbi:unnamed protein product [Symbiodinium pilosum]|uniref:Uncharacterized protein n=1 Tax=Symbiodinium pilosum TaxID=2952 RepID=A0A812VFK9_SYMPI|nr:unnamed protein product [Symbiodinium pilosum]
MVLASEGPQAQSKGLPMPDLQGALSKGDAAHHWALDKFRSLPGAPDGSGCGQVDQGWSGLIPGFVSWVQQQF